MVCGFLVVNSFFCKLHLGLVGVLKSIFGLRAFAFGKGFVFVDEAIVCLDTVTCMSIRHVDI